MTEISSCVITKCINSVVHDMHYYSNCNETAMLFSAKQVFLSTDQCDKIDRLPYKHFLSMS
jgi:hypothetical protein